MHRAVLHLGSNLGDRKKNLDLALHHLQSELDIIACSEVYCTAAWGDIEQQEFFNQALLIDTEFGPFELLEYCMEVGAKFPEKEGERWGPRHMDIDIIFFEDEIIDSDLVKIPHPRMHLRNFVLIPLLDIAPDYIHPSLNKTIEELYLASEDYLEVRLLEID